MATEEKVSRKRALQGEDGSRKKRRKRAVRGDDDGDLDAEAGLNKAFERMDGQLIADHLAQKTSRFGTDLSPVELSDLYISGREADRRNLNEPEANAFKDTTSWQKPRSLENLPEYLETFSDDPKKLEEAPENKGSPHTVIVAGAGLRAADLVRSVRKFQKKGNTVAKLFAKHMKLEEQVSFLEKSRTGIAVGTPQRLMDLLDNGALSVGSLKRIVVDASHIDQKKRGIMDMRETMMPLAKLLSRKEFKDKYTDPEQPIDLFFY
ncbi:protein cms1 [Diplogelasinospora grovesii]|uniref:Protein cms1 n=1 Tax=Diplogelasinospora grovesii TaxID=303347 RepID=A0AAN6NFF7_9PEZI|nr:protein cms1 [Diplogelasinospora grovesii]